MGEQEFGARCGAQKGVKMKGNWKKKTWTAALIACLLFVTACGKNPAADAVDRDDQSQSETVSEENPGGDGSAAEDADTSEETSGEETVDGDETPVSYTLPDSLESNEDIENARKYIWQEYLSQVKNDETRAEEIQNQAMSFGDATMKYGITVKGEPGESGYPVYIALHGGGQSDTPELNDSQWEQMGSYYISCVRDGIYVFPRGVRDTWDCHFNPESYPLYDRLIENLIVFYDADPNRVYLVGFSAGGDGVYAITAKMADRFGAANMSAGHPNGLPLWNLYNMPLQLQVGEKDSAYDRNICTAQYGLMLDEYREQLGGGYIHNTYVHKGSGHNFRDYAASDQEVLADIAAWLESGDNSTVTVDTNAIRFVRQYVRDPLPERVVWDLSQRADQRTGESFYWLRADRQLTEGRIIASYDREANSVNVEECSVSGEITILLSNDMLDLFSPITINTSAGSQTVTVTPDFDLLYETTAERGDYNYQFAAKITITF